MLEHKWHQKAFTDGGYYHGFQTCLNIWGCKTCGLEIELPLGINPKQYDHTTCKEVTNATNTNVVQSLHGDSRMQTSNRHDRRSSRV